MASTHWFGRAVVVINVGTHLLGCASTPCEETLTCPRPPPDAESGSGGEVSVGGRPGAGGSPTGGRSSSMGGAGAGGARSGNEEVGGEAGQSSVGEAAAGGRAGEGGSDGSLIAPGVIGMTPRNGAVAVASDQVLQIKFSEPMDVDSVAEGLTLTDFLPGELELTWNSDRTSVAIVPNGGFAYATASDDAIPARVFTLALNANVRAQGGVELGRAFVASFSTLRRIKRAVQPMVYGWDTYGGTANEKTHPCESDDQVVYAGTFANMAASGTNYTFIAFDAAAVGDPDTIVSEEEALFSAVQLDPTGAFYSGGSVELEKVAYGVVDNQALQLPVTDDFGPFVTSAATSRPTLDVTVAFWDDYVQGGQRQLYRLSPHGNDDNTRALFRCDGFGLEVTYLIP